jgi:hypothetical protein
MGTPAHLRPENQPPKFQIKEQIKMNENQNPTPAPDPEPNQDRTEPAATVGNILQEGMHKAVKTIVVFMSILIYLAGVIYAEVHGLSMLSKGVNPDFLMWAYIGMMALGFSAIALPLALHFWTFAHLQRIFTFGFYAVDFGLLILNAFLDYAGNTGGQIAGWAQMYLTYIMPATPVLCAIGWSVVWLLDPATKAHVLRQTLRSSIIESKANQVANAAKASAVTQAVNAAAEKEVADALTELFGRPVTMTKEAGKSHDSSFRPE